MPAPRYCSIALALSPLLSPLRQPPPWMYRTSGVGLSDSAFQKSSTCRSCAPYASFATVGVGCGAGFFFSCAASLGFATTRNRAMPVKMRFMVPSPNKLPLHDLVDSAIRHACGSFKGDVIEFRTSALAFVVFGPCVVDRHVLVH